MLQTNINITDSNYRPHIYLVRMLDNNSFIDAEDVYYIADVQENCQFIYKDSSNFKSLDSTKWCEEVVDTENLNVQENYSRDMVAMRTIRVLFPLYSLDSATKSINKLLLEAYTYINGTKIILGKYLIQQTETLVQPKVELLQQEYYEYIDVNIIDPYEFCYSDDWRTFRQDILCEKPELNNSGSVISFTITPVENDVDSNILILSNTNLGGMNSFRLEPTRDDCIHARLNFINNYKYNPKIQITIDFHNEYDSLKEYFKETYNINYNLYVWYQVVVRDKENIWKVYNSERELVTDTYKPIFSINRDTISFDSWNEYSDTILFEATVNFDLNIDDVDVDLSNYVPEKPGDTFINQMYLITNPIYISPELFKFFIVDTDVELKKINYKNIEDMITYNINTVNKIEKKIINVERSSDYKSNIIRPVFFRAQESNYITIHSTVTENISINLDSYKSKVSSFRLQVEGINFTEIGRNNTGVIFRITGNSLPKENTNGIYYILDENSELVTTGTYSYI